ncbi:MAG: hypothetical protein KAS21_01880 [Candidatus Aminicenantes bacterium]|nr:hypothetical protein [Candidatus Aminicenantes bacterium]
MKKRTLSTLVVVIFLFGIFGNFSSRLNATSESTIRTYNIVGQGVGTLIRGLIQGKVKSVKSAAKMLFWGSLSGYGFYESKKMIGEGLVTKGIILANISASITENTARGDNPFAYLGYTLGPARIQVATPLAGKDKTLFNVQISPMDAIGFAIAMSRADSVSFRNGMISFEANEAFTGNARGWALGIYPTVVTGVPEHVFYHESIHVVQYIQTMSVSPQPLNCLLDRGIEGKKLFNISLLNFNFAAILNGFTLNDKNPNVEIWNEIEAYALAKE